MIIQDLDKNNSGFTLIELLITMLIMVIALFALSALKNQTLRATVSAQNVTEATACAEAVMEELINHGYSGVLNAPAFGDCPDDRFTWEVTIDSSVDSLDLRKISVDVEWFRGMVTIETLLSDR
jgi:prepilin-type N-terminal cleavage/methylation domain-containing protein